MIREVDFFQHLQTQTFSYTISVSIVNSVWRLKPLARVMIIYTT